MQYVIEYNKYTDTKILEKGTILYHGSSENIKLPLKVGGDGVLWTAKELEIARMYIPVSGSTMHTSLDILINPKDKYAIENILPQLGIIYKDAEYTNNRLTSYIIPDIYKEIEAQAEKEDAEHYALFKEIDEIKKEYKELEKTITQIKTAEEAKKHKADYDKMNVLLDKWSKLEDKQIELIKNRKSFDNAKKEIVKKKLLELGYKDEDGDYKLKMNGNKIIHSDENLKGKVFKLSLTKDLKFFDYAKDREADLTDLDYKKYDLFEKVEKEGYDGIRITDYAQSDYHGNYGHISYGFFKDSIKHLEIVEVIETTHPKSEEFK